jgi:hypothetical protein
MNRETLLLGLVIALALGIGGCSGGAPISIEFTTPPPTSLNENQTASIVATVMHDSSNSGVDWSCTPTGACGGFAPSHTASGATTMYTAPGSTGNVSIIATSTKNPAKFQMASVMINQPPPLSIMITTPPPSSLEINLTASIAATVTNDPANNGVDWSCTPMGTCGTFTPAHTASGATTVYMAPNTPGPVTITAASTTEPSQTAPAKITINPITSIGNITGTYTFFANGADDNGGYPISVAGSVVLGGATITGEQDYFDAYTDDVFPADPIVSGSLSVGNDGRGTLTLTPTSAPAETFSITVVNNKHILITEFDSNATTSGSLDLQTSPTSVPSGGNAFALLDSADAYALGGVLTSNGTSLTASEADDDIKGFPNYDFPLSCPVCTITAPDAAGRGTITLTDPNTGVGAMEMAYYVVGPEAFRLIEFDNLLLLTGSMYGQGSGTFSAATLGKSFVFGQSGLASLTGAGFGLWATAGQFTGDGTSALSSGVADFNNGDGQPVLASPISSGSAYSVSANGYAYITLSGATTYGLVNFGVYLVDPAVNIADPNNASGGGGAVMLDLDVNTLGIGMMVPQTSGASFTGNYGIALDGFLATSPTAFAYYGLVGQVVSSGTSFSGLADYNELGVAQTPAVTVSGPVSADMANPGRSTAQVTINGAATPNNITLYQASNGLLLGVDVDSTSNDIGNVGLGLFEQQQ